MKAYKILANLPPEIEKCSSSVFVINISLSFFACSESRGGGGGGGMWNVLMTTYQAFTHNSFPAMLQQPSFRTRTIYHISTFMSHLIHIKKIVSTTILTMGNFVRKECQKRQTNRNQRSMQNFVNLCRPQCAEIKILTNTHT